jgi:CRISPR/Cas system-associated protein Csm6
MTAQVFKKFATAKTHANGLPIVRIDNLYIVIETADKNFHGITSIDLIDTERGNITGTVTLRHLARLGNANWATPKA